MIIFNIFGFFLERIPALESNSTLFFFSLSIDLKSDSCFFSFVLSKYFHLKSSFHLWIELIHKQSWMPPSIRLQKEDWLLVLGKAKAFVLNETKHFIFKLNLTWKKHICRFQFDYFNQSCLFILLKRVRFLSLFDYLLVVGPSYAHFFSHANVGWTHFKRHAWSIQVCFDYSIYLPGSLAIMILLLGSGRMSLHLKN